MLGRPLSARRVLCWLLVLGCGSGGSTRGSSIAANDGSSPETDADAKPLLRPDGHTGLAGGTSCDSSAQCLSGACTLGVCSDWAHAMRIDVDTSESGADLAQAVTDFPLLVRLRPTNFVFAEARMDGADLRFVDRAGIGLSHEIERWNQTASLGEVWVLVPRIEAGQKDNHILMYWGNPQAAATSSGPAVFGDLLCALHMGDAAGGIEGHLQDASGQGNSVDFERQPAGPTPTEGAAGPGLLLAGTRAYLGTWTLRMSPSTFAISLWLNTTSTAPAGIAGFVDKDHLRFAPAIWMDERGRLSFGVQRTTGGMVKVSSLTGYNDGAWHHVVARFSNNGQYLFVDGEAIADDPTRSGTTSVNGSWCFGQDPVAVSQAGKGDAASRVASSYAGSLDEIRLATSAPSDAWIKLAHATQRPDVTAVRYQHLP
jgi:hypothetical protein